MADLASRGADPTRILFDFDANGNAKRLDPTIFTKKYDVQVVSEADLGHLGDWFHFSENQYVVGSPAQLLKDVEVRAWVGDNVWEPIFARCQRMYVCMCVQLFTFRQRTVDHSLRVVDGVHAGLVNTVESEAANFAPDSSVV